MPTIPTPLRRSSALMTSAEGMRHERQGSPTRKTGNVKEKLSKLWNQ